MLQVTIPASEFFDPSTSEFMYTKEQTLVFEHSLLSISKWESKWHTPFFSHTDWTREEKIDYLKCMTLTQNVPSSVYMCIPPVVMENIQKYIDDSMTATWFKENESKPSKEVITSEVVYYWMVSYGIPFECQKWHINRLLTLVRVCSEMNKPKKKMSQSEIRDHHRALNAARRAKQHAK